MQNLFKQMFPGGMNGMGMNQPIMNIPPIPGFSGMIANATTYVMNATKVENQIPEIATDVPVELNGKKLRLSCRMFDEDNEPMLMPDFKSLLETLRVKIFTTNLNSSRKIS